MMNNIINLYSEIKEDDAQNFQNNLSSNLQVKKKINKSSYDDTWLVKMEDTIRYLDNILRNPNRFIVNDEEIVKIELARRITVESIKHLSRNTNLIQKYDPKTGEVKPSKILNINKEESFNTYENRFIYTLINNMKFYIERKKQEDISDGKSENMKDLTYQGKSKLDGELVEISLHLNGHKEKGKQKTDNIMERISSLEEKIQYLCGTDVYRNLNKMHFAPVISPIKKTNLILKNVNFQYALDLWNYMQLNMDPSLKKDNTNQNYEDKGALKEMMNQNFLLNCLIMNTLDEDKVSETAKEEIKNQTVHNTVGQLLNLNDKLSLEELMKLVGDEYARVKYKKVVDTSEIERTYKEAINNYIDKIKPLKLTKDE